ncbi:MAG TPA: DUF503 domain-containing protein [Phycisphaerales bacterium]|nr:DUF503 domain-containing protein [Phycisphaerales bacterium]
MYIAILQFHMMIDGSTGLKDKRRVVRSIKDKLHRDHMVAVAEVDDLETWNLATLGLVACNRSEAYLQEQMQAIIRKLETHPAARLADHALEIISAESATADPVDEAGKPLWTEAEKREEA